MPKPPWLIVWLSEQFWWIIGGGTAALLLMWFLAAVIHRPRRRESTSWGSARWATRPEIAQVGLLDGEGIVLGQFGSEILRSSSESHVMLIAPTRWGKGVSTIIPTLLTIGQYPETFPWDVVCWDIKGENYQLTAAYRQTLGPVYRFNPTDPNTDRINILDGIRWKTIHEVTDVARIAESLCTPQTKPDESTEFHRDNAVEVLTTVFLYLRSQATFPVSLGGAWDFLGLPLAQRMQCLQQSPDPEVQRGVSFLVDLRQRQGDAWVSARRKLDVWRDRLVCVATEATDIPLDEIQRGQKPMTIYFQVTAEDLRDRLRPLFRVILEYLANRLMDRPIHPAPRKRLLIILDEFAQMGYLPIIENLISLLAGYGIYVLLVLQSMQQLWENYGENTGILDNCTVRVFGAPNNPESAATFERMLGMSTVKESSTRLGGHRFMPVYEQQAESQMSHARPLLTAAEILELPMDDVLVRVPACPPIKGTKLRYYADRRFTSRVAAHHGR